MKTTLLAFSLVTLVSAAWSQTELDDLYFNSKDRQREMDLRPKINRNSMTTESFSQETYPDESYSYSRDKTSSQIFDGQYSGRLFNPDFDPASDEGIVEDYNYFSSTFSPIGVNNRLYNQSFDPRFPSNTFANSWNNFYSPWGFNRFNDPFFSPYGWGMGDYGPMFDPFYGNGCFSCYSSTWNFGFGNSWSRFNYGFNNFGWNNPYWGFGYGYTAWNRPTVIINQFDRYPMVVYGKRPSRSTNFNNDAIQNIRGRQSAVTGEGSRSSQSGRVASERSSNYYQRGWKQDPTLTNRGSSSAVGTKSETRSSGWLTNPSSGWKNDNSSRGSSGFGNSHGGRSSGFSGSGFSSGSGGSGSSGGRRGRN